METGPISKVYQSTPMFDDPISSASEDENRASRTTFRSKVVTVPLQNYMRLAEGPRSVISTSRTMSASVASTSRAGLRQVATSCNTVEIIDGSWSQSHIQEPTTSTSFERIERLSSFRKERWQCVLNEINRQRWSNIGKIRSKEGNRYQVPEGRFLVRTSSR